MPGPPTYLSVLTNGGVAGGTANSTAVPLTITANSGCGSLPVGNTTAFVYLYNAPAPDQMLTVTIQVGAATTLTASPVALSYVLGSGPAAPATAYLADQQSTTLSGTGTTLLFFVVDTSSLPLRLNTNITSGIVGTNTLKFLPTAGAETLALGTYSASVHLKVSGSLDTTVAVTLQVKSSAETIKISEGTTKTGTWTLRTALPTFLITPISTGDEPIPYPISVAQTGGGLVPQVSSLSGVAYSFGPPIPITFLQAPFRAAAPGAVLSGTVTIAWTAGGGGSIPVTITFTAVSPGATILASPSSLATAAPGGAPFTMVLTGTGFVASSNPALATTVGVVSNGVIVPDSAITVAVQNSTTIDLTINVPATSTRSCRSLTPMAAP